MIYRPGRAVLFAVAAAAAAWGAWPRPPADHALVGQVGVITTVLLLAGLPLLARRFLGPASESRAGRFLRVGSLRGDPGPAADPVHHRGVRRRRAAAGR